MKFYCDNCGAKYQISDEKVRGKVLRIRCKKCSASILVKEPARPSSDAQKSLRDLQSRLRSTSRPTLQRGQSAVSKSASQAATLQWYYSISGQTFGPMSWGALSRKFELGELGDEAYVWNKTMAEWIPAVKCAELQPFFKGGKTRRPSNPTITLGAADIRKAAQARMEAQKGAVGEGAAKPPQRGASSPQGGSLSAAVGSSRILQRASKTLSAAPRSPILSKATSGETLDSQKSSASRRPPVPGSGAASTTGEHVILDGKAGPDATQDRLKALRQRLRPEDDKPRSTLRERLRAVARKAESKRREDEAQSGLLENVVQSTGAPSGQERVEPAESVGADSTAAESSVAAPVSSLAASLRAAAGRHASGVAQEERASVEADVSAPTSLSADAGDLSQEIAEEAEARAAGLDPSEVTMEMSLGAALEAIADQVKQSNAADAERAVPVEEQGTPAEESVATSPDVVEGDEPAADEASVAAEVFEESGADESASSESAGEPAVDSAKSGEGSSDSALDDDAGIMVFTGGAASAKVSPSVPESRSEDVSPSLEVVTSEVGRPEPVSPWSMKDEEDHTIRASIPEGLLAEIKRQVPSERQRDGGVKLQADLDATAVLEVDQALLDQALAAEEARVQAEAEQEELALESSSDEVVDEAGLSDATSLTVSAISDEDALMLDDLKALSAAATEVASVDVVEALDEDDNTAAAFAAGMSEQELMASLGVEGVEGQFWNGAGDESDATVPEFAAFAEAMSESAGGSEAIEWPEPVEAAPVSPAAPVKSASAASQLRPASKAAQDSFARDDEMSASLLIQIDDVKKSKRRQNTLMIIGVVAALFLLAGVGVVVMSMSSTANEELAKKADESRARQEEKAKTERKRQDEKIDKPKGYDPEELSALGGVMPSAEVDAGGESEEPDAEEGAGQGEGAQKRAAAKRRDDGRLIDIAGLTRDNNKFDKAMERTAGGQSDARAGGREPGETGLRLKTTGEGDVVKSDGPVEGVGRVDDKAAPGEDPLKALGSMSPSQVEGRQREDAVKRAELPTSISREDLSKGFVNIRKSVFQCVERHTKRSGSPMESGKVRVTVTILNNGSVGDVSIDAALRNTVFGMCMKSHTSRWRFPPFQGTPMKVKRTFVIQ